MVAITPTLTVTTMLQSSSTNLSNGGVSSLLSTSTGSNASTMLGAISGATSLSSSSDNLFNAIHPGSTATTIDGLLQQQKITTQKNAIFANVAQRLDAMHAGTYQPKADWEKVAAYAMQTGKAVAITLTSKGAIQAVPQAQADLSKYSVQQQNKLLATLDDITTMSGKITANKTNDGMLNKLASAEYTISLVATGQQNATSDWDAQGASLMTQHHPFTISLNAQGNLQVQDQLTDPMSDLSLPQQKILRQAVESIPKVLSTGYVTTSWQVDAQTFDKNATPYHLTIDPVSNQISAVENSADNITPAFLKETPYPDIGDHTPALKQAAALIQKGQPYFLDFDPNGQISAKQATTPNLITYNATSTQASTALGSGSILSLFA